MAAHSVKLKVEHPLNVGNLGVEFEVRRGGKLLGKLEVTQSTIEWTPAKARNPRKASWQDFGDWMEARSGRQGPARPAAGQARAAVPVDAVDAVDAADEADAAEGEAVDLAEPVEIEAVEIDDVEVDEEDADDVLPPPTTRSSWV